MTHRGPDLSTLRFAPRDLHSAFVGHPAPTLLYDPATLRILAVNTAGVALYGRPEAELAALTLDDICSPRTCARQREEIETLHRAGGAGWLRCTHLGRDGQPIELELLSQPMELEGRPIRRAAMLDVTARIAGERALAESEHRFRAAFDQAMSGMSITALDGRFLRVNRALCELFGYSEEELGRLTFQELTHPEDLQANLVQLQLLIDGALPGFRLEKRYLHKNGGVVWVALNVSALRDEAGRPTTMLSQLTDITPRKLAERKLRESEAQLRHAQKMEAVGRLAGGVAHDFNNLLTVIGSNAEIGLDVARGGGATPDEFLEIRAAVERAAALTRQLLAFSRRQVLAPVPLLLNDLVAHAERMLRRVIGEDVTLETRLDPAVYHVVADPGQLEQVLMNLVVNARDAMPDGGPVVIATAAAADGMAALIVSDSGVGMDPDTQSRAFEPFFTTKEPGKGTGLGLSTVYGIATQSGGDVTIRSAVGAGTTITLRLPHHLPAPVAALPGGHAAPPPVAGAADGEGEGETILLVEDEQAVRTVVRRILGRAGYRVVEASNGVEALAQWGEHRGRIRLVLTDAVMPEMGGIELAQRLVSDGAAVPVVFMSGYADGERGGEIPVGADLIGKPFAADALVERLRATIARSGPRPRADSPRG